MRSPPLSPSQRAYLFQRESFLARIEERAARLDQDGYTVEMGARCHEFLVTPPNTGIPYVVNALCQTCTCCFYRRQVEGEPLTRDGTPVPCKHLQGLKGSDSGRTPAAATGRALVLFVPALGALAANAGRPVAGRTAAVNGRRHPTLPLPTVLCAGTAPRREHCVDSGMERRRTAMKMDEVQERIARDNDGKWDNLLSPEEMLFQGGRLTFPRLYRADHPKGLGAHRVGHRPGVPTAQHADCVLSPLPHAPAGRPSEPLAASRASGGGQGSGKKASRTARTARTSRDRWFLRAKNDVLRGALSERYTRLDNADLLTALLPSLDARFEVAWFALTDESLHLRLLDPRLSRDVLPNDRLVAGLHIANSEVGKRSVTLDALVYRLVCQNGLVRLVKGKSLLHRRHIAVTPAHMELALKNAMRDALMQSTGFMERLSWATPVSTFRMCRQRSTRLLAQEWGLSQTLRDKVQDAILTEARHQHETLYGLVNGLTSVAQTLQADERYTLETLAGKLLESGPPRVQAQGSSVGNSCANVGIRVFLLSLTTASALVGERVGELSLFAGDALTNGAVVNVR